MWPYKTEADAVNDVLRLSRGMTYKNAVAGLNIGGGKAVIIGDPAKDKSEALFRAFGQLRRFAQRPLHHRRRRRHRRQRHGIRVPRDRVRHRRAPGARRLGRPVAVHRLRHAAGPDGRAQQEIRRRGRRQVHAMPCRARATSAWSSSSCCASSGAKVFVTDINKALVEQAVDEYGCRSRRPGRNLRRRCRRLFALRARRHGQRADAAAPEGQDHLRRGQQPAGQRRDRRRSARSAACSTRRTTRSTPAAS